MTKHYAIEFQKQQQAMEILKAKQALILPKQETLVQIGPFDYLDYEEEREV
jgi:hypothetical protein